MLLTDCGAGITGQTAVFSRSAALARSLSHPPLTQSVTSDQTCSHRPAATDLQPQTCSDRPAATDLQPQTCSHGPAARPAATDLQPQTCSHRPAVTDLQPPFDRYNETAPGGYMHSIAIAGRPILSLNRHTMSRVHVRPS